VFGSPGSADEGGAGHTELDPVPNTGSKRNVWSAKDRLDMHATPFEAEPLLVD
jgi:hypothetical protein